MVRKLDDDSVEVLTTLETTNDFIVAAVDRLDAEPTPGKRAGEPVAPGAITPRE